MASAKRTSPWVWIPSLYYAEGIPYIIVMTLSVIMYKRLGISNTDIALYTSWLYLPWVIKPLWSPVVDMLKTKRFWIVIMQLVIGAGLAGVALTIPVPNFFKLTLAFFWLLAFSSATHDIAADGFYLLGMPSGDQAFFVGIRSTFYRFAMLTGQGLLVILAGYLESSSGMEPVVLEVTTDASVKTELVFEPKAQLDGQQTGELYFITESELTMGTNTIAPTKADSIKKAVDGWNIAQGFYQAEAMLANGQNDELSWWTKSVSAPFGAFLKKQFGEQAKVKSAVHGNMAVVSFQLSGQPETDETVVMNFGYDKGDASIKLAKAYRYEFNDKNWDKPAYAVVQLDHKLQKNASATFVGRSGNLKFAWSVVFGVISVFFFVVFIYHRFALPRPDSDKANMEEGSSFVKEFLLTFKSFFQKKEIGMALVFLLIYRLAESQIVKMASPFLLDAKEAGGLGIATGDLGFVYGTVGMVALTLGGISGGILASRNGLKHWLWWMIIAMNLPNGAYLLLSIFTPDSLVYIASAVAVEQFGYGFGFTAYMLFMIYVSEGKHKTAHFAITTGFMALGMMIPGMLSGWLQEIIGYQNFFVWVLICTIPGFAMIPFMKIDPKFGKKEVSS